MKNTKIQATVVSVAFVSLAFLAGCATTSQHNAKWAAASDKAAKICTSPYKAGSCFEREMSREYPEWVRHERAKSIALYYAFLDAAGDRLKNGYWSRAEYEDKVQQFGNRLMMQMAEKERAEDAATQQRIYAGLVKFNEAMAKDRADRAKELESRAFMRSSLISCQPWMNGFQCF